METLKAQQLADEGQADYKKGEYLSAARLFKAAADGFSFTGDELSAAEMANNCSVAYLKGGDAKTALEAVTGTDLVFASKGDIKRQAMAVGNRAAALEGLNRLEEAILAYEESAELFTQAGEFELRAYVYQSLSSVQLKRGQYLEAYAIMRAGVMGVKEPNLTQRLLQTLMDMPFKFLK
jgi:tetratricopeptide (TPR) repeat protein